MVSWPVPASVQFFAPLPATMSRGAGAAACARRARGVRVASLFRSQMSCCSRETPHEWLTRTSAAASMRVGSRVYDGKHELSIDR